MVSKRFWSFLELSLRLSVAQIVITAGSADQRPDRLEKVYFNARGDAVNPEILTWGHYAMKERDAARLGTLEDRLDIGGPLGKRQMLCPTLTQFSCGAVCCNTGQSCCGSSVCCLAGQYCQGTSTCCSAGQIGCGEACCNAGYTCCASKCCRAGFTCFDGICSAPGSFNTSTVTPRSASTDSTNSSTSSQESSNKASTGIIAGATIGGILVLSVLVGVLILYKQRKRRSGATCEKQYSDQGPSATYAIPSPPVIHEGGMYSGSGSPNNPEKDMPAFFQREPAGSNSTPHPVPVLSEAEYGHSSGLHFNDDPNPSNRPAEPNAPTREPPPRYGTSATLMTWADSNRGLVTEDLEAKLLVAGYVPTDNPDSFTEEEWQMRYGVTRLELLRLRKLYARDHGEL